MSDKNILLGDECPKCKSDDLHRCSLEVSDKEGTQEVSCNECGEEWIAVYTLTEIWC